MADETNTVLKHFQIFRNESINVYSTYAVALGAAKDAWKSPFVSNKGLKDGEFVLFNYKLSETGKVESILGIVRSGAIDIIGSYDQLTTEYKDAIKALDGSATIASVADGVVTLKAGIAETDGKIANNTATDITLAKVATTGAADDVAVATAIEGLTANNVQGALAELAGEIAALDAAQLSAGTGIEIDTNNKINANFDIAIETRTGENAGEYIVIKDGENVIAEVNANAFVKDGFLQKVELIEATAEGQENVLRFSWNSDAGISVTEIKVSDLCDVYTAKENDWIQLNGFEFSHKTQSAFTQVEGQTAPQTTFGANATDVTVNSTAEKSFKVPTLTVDEAGHVTAASEKTVTIKLPATIDTAVQTVSGNGYVSAEKSGTNVSLRLQTQTMAGVAVEDAEDGLATASDVKTYVDSVANTAITDAIANLDAAVTSTDGTNVQVKVTEVDGIITAVNVTTDNTINATDLQTAIKALDTPEGGVSNAETNNVKVTVKQVDGIVNSVEVVDNSVNATDVSNAITAAINELDSTKSNVEALTNGAATNDIRVEVVETDGKLTSVNVTDTLAKVAHSGKAADVAVATGIEGLDATTVQAALAELQGDIAALDAAQLSAGKGIDIDGTTINADLKLSIANETTGEGESAVTTTYLYIKDTEGNEISKVNANTFVKDGFLQSVTEDATNNTLVFTWNTDAGVETTTIAISDLCDVYTADETYLYLEGYKFKHKTITGLDSTNAHGITEAVTVDSTVTKTFQVPTLKVDAAGHVVSVDEQTVTITLPAKIDTAIQGGAGVNTTYIKTTVARNTTNTNQLDVTATAVIGNYAAEGQVDGLATTSATKTYVNSVANTAIANLNNTVTDSNEKNDITVKVTQTAGKLESIEVTDSLKQVAHTGAAADVSIADTGNKIVAENVEGALVELATAIDILEAVDTWDAGTY